MATQGHCAYCFETLVASFEQRPSLSLVQVEELWEQYHTSKNDPLEVGKNEEQRSPGERVNQAIDESATARPTVISRLLGRDSAVRNSAASSNSSLPSTRSAASSTPPSGTDTPESSSSSRTSLYSLGRGRARSREEHPLFVTWNTVARSGHKSLRGCIGTFEPHDLDHGLRSYALTSAFEDVRFRPIPASLLPQLSNHVTLLTNFSQPTSDPMDWTLGTHGLRISFTARGRRHGATYLPDVAQEQGWTKEETLVSLMQKAGWKGGSGSWLKAWEDGRGEIVRYEGKQVGLGYDEWRGWRDWVDTTGVTGKALD